MQKRQSIIFKYRNIGICLDVIFLNRTFCDDDDDDDNDDDDDDDGDDNIFFYNQERLIKLVVLVATPDLQLLFTQKYQM